MDYFSLPNYFPVWLPTIIFSSTLFFFLFIKLNRPKNLPPGPPGWPIIGNMLDLGTMPHRTLSGLGKKYGPVIFLKLGSINTMVILSTKSCTQFFKHHDLSFIERTVNETSRVHDYDKSSLALAPYGSYWRVMRRILTVDMLVARRINETVSVRRRCVDNMLGWIEAEAAGKVGEKRSGVYVARFVFFMTFNLLGNLMMSKDVSDHPRSEVGTEFFEAMKRLMEWSGYANLADYFPWLRRFDPQGLKRKMEKDLGKALEIASKFVKERLDERKLGVEREGKDFLDVLLEFEGNGKDEPDKFSEKDLNIFILELFMAGSETTSSSIEWAMTELLCNPTKMLKAKQELSNVVGKSKKLEESDTENLPYLQSVIKETLRLHPPIPFLVPRRAIHDTNFMNYHVPKDTQVLVNAWAIGRDPDVWEDPLKFNPERFMGSKIDYKGQNYELIPFGAGRRMCAGVSLAHQVLVLVLGSLIHEFDWELDESVSAESMDMNDTLGITMRKSQPLFAVPKKCV